MWSCSSNVSPEPEGDTTSVTDSSVQLNTASVTDSSVQLNPASVTDSSVQLNTASVTDSSVQLNTASVTDSSVKLNTARQFCPTEHSQSSFFQRAVGNHVAFPGIIHPVDSLTQNIMQSCKSAEIMDVQIL